MELTPVYEHCSNQGLDILLHTQTEEYPPFIQLEEVGS
jgi:hypothetical protein